MAMAIEAEDSLPFPVLYCTNIYIRCQDADEPFLDLLLGAEFKTLHASDDLSVQLVSTEGLTVQHMDVWRTIKSTTHPRVIHHFGQWGTICGICYEHSGQEVLAFWAIY